MAKYRVTIEPVSGGATIEVQKTSSSTTTLPTTKEQIIVDAGSEQILGLRKYAHLITEGEDTSTVETALDAI